MLVFYFEPTHIRANRDRKSQPQAVAWSDLDGEHYYPLTRATIMAYDTVEGRCAPF